MYPASNGTISLNAASPPICINAAAKVPGSLYAVMPNTNDNAISSPPATTIGNMNDTPVSRCLYTPVFSDLTVPEAPVAADSCCPSLRAFFSVASDCLSAIPVPQR